MLGLHQRSVDRHEAAQPEEENGAAGKLDSSARARPLELLQIDGSVHTLHVIQPMTASVSDPWIACRKPRPQARLRLFCFPYAGGGASIFRTWPDGLPADVEVCPVQLPGRGTRLMERPFTQLSPLVEALAQALLPLLDKPFAFFGHSLGALVSFELARHLRRQYGVHPVRLFVSACRAPQIPHRDRPIHTLPEAEFLAELRRLNGTPAEVLEHEELMRDRTSRLAGGFRAVRNLCRTRASLP